MIFSWLFSYPSDIVDNNARDVKDRLAGSLDARGTLDTWVMSGGKRDTCGPLDTRPRDRRRRYAL